MRPDMRSALCVAVCLLLLVCADAKKKNYPRSKYGVKLVDGSGPRGRVELLTEESYFLQNSATASKGRGYIPLCDNSFSDEHAEIMCRMLGYKFGRKYYHPTVNYNVNQTDIPAGNLECEQVRFGRKLASLAHTAGSAGAVVNAGARRSLAPLLGKLLSFGRPLFECIFRIGDCDSTGPLAGIECSYNELPPAPSPPPSPPSPPPAPPPVSDDIKLFGGSHVNTPLPLEPNLCPDTGCDEFGRVELKVDDPAGGGTVWAPLCAVDDGLVQRVAEIVCEQVFNWPSLKRIPIEYVAPWPSSEPFIIPEAAASADDFDPAKYPAWLTVLGWKPDVSFPLRVQDLNVSVTTTPCESGKMFAVHCALALSRRH